jgi:hypothetical protein
VRQHQLARRIEVVVIAQSPAERALLFGESSGNRLTVLM